MPQTALSARTVLVALTCLSLLAACSSTKIQAPVTDRSPGQVPPVAAPAAAPSAAPAAPTTYTVKKGDTVYSIAAQFGTDARQLATWNGLDAQYHLHIDQVLRVAPTAGSDAATATPIASNQVEQRPLSAMAATGDQKPKTGPLGAKRPYSDSALAEMSRSDSNGASAEVPLVAAAVPAAPAAAPAPEADSADQVSWGWPATGPVITEFNEARNPGINIGGKTGTPIVAAADGRVIFAGQGPRGYGTMVIIKNSPNLLSVYAHNSKLYVAEQDNVRRGQKIAEMGDTEADRTELHFEIRVQSKPVDPLKYLPGR